MTRHNHAVIGMRRAAMVLGALVLSLSAVNVTFVSAHDDPTRPTADTPANDPRRGLHYDGLRRSDKCPGGFEIVSRGTCTHGPDAFPQGISAASTPAFRPTIGATQVAAAPPVTCDGNGTSGKRVEVLYVVASNKTNRYATVVDSIRQWMADADTKVHESGLVTGESRRIRFVHDASCQVVVRNVTVSSAAANDFSTLIDELIGLGYDSNDRKYLSMMDANVYCGIGELWPDDSKGGGNFSNGFLSTFSRVDVPCWATGSLGDSTALHEISHNLGAVQESAPNDSGGGHCIDEWDLMCYSDEPNYPSMVYKCPSEFEALLDCENNDYFHTSPPTNNYLYSHWNLADSEFLLNSEGDEYVTLSAPVRVLDTRSGVGGVWGAMTPNSFNSVRMAGALGVPDYADAVVVNITAVDPSSATYLSAFPSGTVKPLASNLNVAAGQTRANLATVKVGSIGLAAGSGWVDIYNYAGNTHVVADVVGYFAHRIGATYGSVQPQRVLDSRIGVGGYSTPWGPGSTRTVNIGSAVPSGATSVVLNLTATRPTASSYGTVFAAGASRPLASNLNYPISQTVPNLVVSRMNASRQVSIYNNSGSVHFVADVVGYFTTSSPSSEFVPLSPSRFMDTRNGTGTARAPFVADETRSLQVGGVGQVPADASAVVVNVTATNATSGGFVTVWPDGSAWPTASALNLRQNQTMANLVMVGLSPAGRIQLYNSSDSVNLIVDVLGYYK